jgi:hypothetical protein
MVQVKKLLEKTRVSATTASRLTVPIVTMRMYIAVGHGVSLKSYEVPRYMICPWFVFLFFTVQSIFIKASLLNAWIFMFFL